MSSKKHARYKLLLDEGLPFKEKFPKLNNLHTLRHINHDLRRGGARDSQIYEIAVKDGSMVVVFNTKDFKVLIRRNNPSVISLSSGLTNKQIDLRLCKVLKNLKPSQKIGMLISVTNEGSVIRKIIKKK